MKNQFDDDFILLDDFLKQNLEVNREHLMNLFDAGEISLFTFIYFKNKQLFFTKKILFPYT
ncbi:hypothetical protein BKK51_06445 [Rodentibacter trehalosifermentans]|uniref:Uncharacterized protein n=1 Tax=Rodentibacter trehalosifermentans TaxID=1908263 RepID=A0A1V3IU32_9PAST|nr:hypothetical protein BKK51_06445 [Rodentibacter trehalosifermentans]